MKYQVLFCMKHNENVFINVVCCSRDQRFEDSFPYLFHRFRNRYFNKILLRLYVILS